MSNWLKNDTTDCPVDEEKIVEVRYADGSREVRRAGDFSWLQVGGIYDVTQYRIIEEPMKTAIPTASGLKTVEVNDDMRDRYAMAALTGLCAFPEGHNGSFHSNCGENQFKGIAEYSFKLADAMLAERGKR